jgi:hypothetical protein
MAHDHGFGDGDGDGYGNGCGHGEGYGGGGGGGDGYGEGDGFGDGDGSGYGNGNGIVIGRVGKYEVVHLAPWLYVRVRCELHSIAYWRDNWREIASDNDVVVDIDFDALLDLAEGHRHGA